MQVGEVQGQEETGQQQQKAVEAIFFSPPDQTAAVNTPVPDDDDGDIFIFAVEAASEDAKGPEVATLGTGAGSSVELLIDSGSAIHTAPPTFAQHVKPLRSNMRPPTTATGQEIQQYGRKVVKLRVGEATEASCSFEITNVTKGILSVAQLVEQGCKIIFSKEGSFLKAGKEFHKLTSKNGQFYLPAQVAALEETPEFSPGEAEEDVLMQGDQDNQAREVPLPPVPSPAEQHRHSMTHVPYAPWCKICVQARGRENKHFSRPRDEPGEDVEKLPVVMWDFTKGKFREDEEPVWILAAMSVQNGWGGGLATGKGTTTSSEAEAWALRFLKELGYPKVMCQCDQENAVKALLDRLQKKYPGQILVRYSPKKSHASAGPVERYCQELCEVIRGLRLELEKNAPGLMLSGQNEVCKWLIRHAAWCLQRYHPWNRGATPHFRLKGKDYNSPIISFGENCLARITEDVKPGTNNIRGPKFEGRFVEGVWLGKAAESDEHLVLINTPDRQEVQRFRTIRRLFENRFSPERLMNITATPFQPKVMRTEGTQEPQPQQPPPQPLAASGAAPPEDPREPIWVKTPGCPGCQARGRHHNVECSKRKKNHQAAKEAEILRRQAEAREQNQGGAAKKTKASDTKESEEKRQRTSEVEPPAQEQKSTAQSSTMPKTRFTTKRAPDLPEAPPEVVNKSTPLESEDVEMPEVGASSSGSASSSGTTPATTTTNTTTSEEVQEGPEAKRARVMMLEAGEVNEEPVQKVAGQDLLTPDKIWEGKMLEVENLRDMNVFQPVQKESWMKVIGTRWVLKPKPDEKTGEMMCRARLVAQDFANSKDFHSEFFASTPSTTTLRLQILQCSGNLQLFPEKKFCLEIWDVSVAFLHADAEDEEYYVQAPPEMSLPEGQVLKCLKSLYGLRKAPRLWEEKATKDLEEAGLTQSKSDPSHFFNTTTQVEVTKHVDDYTVTGPEDEVKKLFKRIQKTQRVRQTGGCHNPGDTLKILGRTITRTTAGFLWESAGGYVDDVLREFKLEKGKAATTPAPTTMTSTASDEALEEEVDLSPEEHKA